MKCLTDKEILSIINEHKPTNKYPVPTDMYKRLGATHVGGKYYFTKEPYIIEGCQKMQEMGYGVVKLWFNKGGGGYPYNSNWSLPKEFTLKQLAEHPYYKTCFDMSFSTIALSISGAGVNTTDKTAIQEEDEIYELSKYLLEQYKNKEIEFVLHNWEGDWIMRGGTGDEARWSRKAGELIKAVEVYVIDSATKDALTAQKKVTLSLDKDGVKVGDAQPTDDTVFAKAFTEYVKNWKSVVLKGKHWENNKISVDVAFDAEGGVTLDNYQPKAYADYVKTGDHTATK